MTVAVRAIDRVAAGSSLALVAFLALAMRPPPGICQAPPGRFLLVRRGGGAPREIYARFGVRVTLGLQLGLRGEMLLRC